MLLSIFTAPLEQIKVGKKTPTFAFIRYDYNNGLENKQK